MENENKSEFCTGAFITFIIEAIFACIFLYNTSYLGAILTIPLKEDGRKVNEIVGLMNVIINRKWVFSNNQTVQNNQN